MVKVLPGVTWEAVAAVTALPGNEQRGVSDVGDQVRRPHA